MVFYQTSLGPPPLVWFFSRKDNLDIFWTNPLEFWTTPLVRVDFDSNDFRADFDLVIWILSKPPCLLLHAFWE